MSIEGLHWRRFALHGPVIDGILCDQSQGIEGDPLPKYHIFCHCVIREYTSKVDKLELNEAQRQQEGEQAEHKSMILPEPQLMLTAGPGMGVPPQYAQAYGVPGYAPNMPYQGYGM
uniref:Uncharacterized protein n=1 Tax=Phlebotomus papatasi TaxID=29031 RepID=A0A1B0EZE4_PHLPP